MDTNETPTEPMTEERFGVECAKCLPLSVQSERDPKNDTKHALAFRCVVTANFASGAHAGPIRTFETPFTTGKANVDRWVKANLDACAQKTREQTADGADIRKRHELGFWGVSGKDAALLFALPSYRNSIDGAPKLAALRESYRPEFGTVLWCLFRDADGIEGYEDWVLWAEDLGYFSDQTVTRAHRVEQVRKAMRDFEACRKAYFFLRSVFGSRFERLVELSREV